MTEIRTFREDDRQELLAFLKRQFPKRDPLSAESFFTWRYDRNPLGDGQASIYLACQQGQIVGCMGAIADRLWDGHSWHECQWLVDLVIDPERRGGLDALRLFQYALTQSGLTMATGVGRHLLRLYQALGWRRLPVWDTLYFPLRPVGLAKLARDIAPRHRWISWTIPPAALVTVVWKPMPTWVCTNWDTACRHSAQPDTQRTVGGQLHTTSTPASDENDNRVDTSSRMQDSCFAAGALKDHSPCVDPQVCVALSSATSAPRSSVIRTGPTSARRVERLDQRIDGLLDELLPHLGVAGFRSEEYLNWKFVDRPWGTHFLWLLEDDTTGQPRGYMVAKLMERPRVARWLELCDYVIHPDDHNAWLRIVSRLGALAVEHRCDFIRLWLSNPQHIAALRRPFWIHQRMRVSEDVFIHSRDPELLDRLATTPWHLTAMVSDRCDYASDEVERRKEEG